MKPGFPDAFAKNKLDFAARRFLVHFHVPDELARVYMRRQRRRQARPGDESADALEAFLVANPLADGNGGGLDHPDRHRLAVEELLVAGHRFERVADGMAEV